MNVNVCITVDTEFTIAGAFNEPTKNKPVSLESVFCNISGKSNGLIYILDILKKYNLNSTFFLEALNTNYFGDGPLQHVANVIKEYNQDIQLHLHPCWRVFKDKKWADKVSKSPPSDTLVGKTVNECVEIIEEGINTFKRIGIEEPKALRTGNLFIDNNIYKAMNLLGLKMSSNVGLGISMPSNKNLRYRGGRHKIDNVLEVPVTTYQDINFPMYSHDKCFTIIGTSFMEMKNILKTANKKNIKTIIILTHPSEFVKRNDYRYQALEPNKVTQKRFQKLCEYLDKNRDKYNTISIRQAVDLWSNSEEKDHYIKVPLMFTVLRYLEGKLI